MARCTTRKEDWNRFLLCLVGQGEEYRHSNPILDYILSVGHTGKNIVVEEIRRWRGDCG